MASVLLCAVYWLIDSNFSLWMGLLVVGANLIDLDHLPVNDWSLKNVIKNYNKIKSYPLHKVYFIIPVVFLSMFTIYCWLGAGLFLHFLMDLVENISLFGGAFRWV